MIKLQGDQIFLTTLERQDCKKLYEDFEPFPVDVVCHRRRPVSLAGKPPSAREAGRGTAFLGSLREGYPLREATAAHRRLREPSLVGRPDGCGGNCGEQDVRGAPLFSLDGVWKRQPASTQATRTYYDAYRRRGASYAPDAVSLRKKTSDNTNRAAEAHGGYRK